MGYSHLNGHHPQFWNHEARWPGSPGSGAETLPKAATHRRTSLSSVPASGRGREHRASHLGTGAQSARQQRPKQRCPGDVPPPHALPPGPAPQPPGRDGRDGREAAGAGEGTSPTLFAGGASPAGRRQPRTEVVPVHRRPSVRVTGSGSRRGLRGASFRGRSLGWKRDAPESGRRPPGQRGGAGSRWTRRRQNRNRNPARPAAAASSARRTSSREAWTGRRPRPGTTARRPAAPAAREPPPSLRGGAARRGRAGRGRDGRRKAPLRPASAPEAVGRRGRHSDPARDMGPRQPGARRPERRRRLRPRAPGGPR